LTSMDILPEIFSNPASWTASEMNAAPGEWLIELTPDQIQELEAAAKHYLSLGLDVGEITADTFPLPHFSQHLQAMKQKLLHGIGLEVLRGLPVDTYKPIFSATIFCGIGAHLGHARSQNAEGHILGHVKNVGLASTDPSVRIYQTAERQNFHTDSADLVALLCLKTAKEGGRSLLVSAETIYNRMRQDAPDLLQLLFQPIATDRRGEVPPGQKPFMTIPVLSWHKGFLTVFYQRDYINSAQRFDDAPRLSSATIAALDCFDKYANDPDLHIGMDLLPGDMQFVYNHSQLHDRTAFVDWPEPELRRHLLRLWLSLEDDRPLPEVFKQRYGSVEIGNRGGIITEKTKLHSPIEMS